MASPRLAVAILCVLALVGSVWCDLELQLLHVVFRHGDKVPHREFQNYPNDPHRDHDYKPVGNGDLTNQGKLREYKIGKMLREQYDEFFGPNYWPSMIYSRSTDVPRTQLSLELVLAGLFPPSENQTWNPQLPWIPAWTFSVPYEMDNLLFPHYCHRYKDAYSRFLRQQSIQEIVNKYRHVMSYLTEHSGKLINSTAAVSYLYNLFKEEAAQNLTLPSWTEQVYPNPMQEILALDFKLRSYTKSLKRLNGGTLLRKMVDDIEEYKAGKLHPADRKSFFFSGHEVNVAAVARALGTDEPLIPAYGATIILETLRDKKGAYFVRVRQWTGVTEQLLIQTIPGCTDVCPYDEFIRLVKDVIPNDDEYHCRRSNTGDNAHRHHHRSLATNVGTNVWHYVFVAIVFVLFGTPHA